MEKQKFDNEKINLEKGKEFKEEGLGSQLEGEEKELRKYDDWRAHCHEKDRNLTHEFREGELHGVVGKEIHDALISEKKNIKKDEKEIK
jgi:hypothetical protein